MKNTEIINILVGGFSIKIIFKKTELNVAKKILKNNIEDFFANFIENKPKSPDFIIEITEEEKLELLSEKNKSKYYLAFFEIIKKNRIKTHYLINIFQFQSLVNFVLLRLSEKNKILFLHSSAVKINNKAYIFLGKSGAGKSTTANLLKNRYFKLSDDITLIRKEASKYNLYQSPILEKNLITKTSSGTTVNSVYFLKKSKHFEIKKITNKEYVLKLISKQIFTRDEHYSTQIKYLMEFISEFDNFYFLYFSKSSKGLIKLLENTL